MMIWPYIADVVSGNISDDKIGFCLTDSAQRDVAIGKYTDNIKDIALI